PGGGGGGRDTAGGGGGARHPATRAESWSTALVTTGTAGVILIGLLVGLAAVILPGTAVLLLVLVGAAELVFAQLADICGKVFQAQQRLHATAGLDHGLGAAQLLAAGCAVSAV